MDSMQEFHLGIRNHYSNIAGEKIPAELLDELCLKITVTIYEQYARFCKQYAKSIKRYSTLKTDDLNHPQILELIIKYFKAKSENNYLKYSAKLLDISEEDVLQFEKQREEFYNMF